MNALENSWTGWRRHPRKNKWDVGKLFMVYFHGISGLTHPGTWSSLPGLEDSLWIREGILSSKWRDRLGCWERLHWENIIEDELKKARPGGMMKLRDHIQNWVRGCHFEQNPEEWGERIRFRENHVNKKSKAKRNQKHESEPSQSMFEVYVQGPQRTEI